MGASRKAVDDLRVTRCRRRAPRYYRELAAPKLHKPTRCTLAGDAAKDSASGRFPDLETCDIFVGLRRVERISHHRERLIVTPDEIGDPYKLKMEVRVNGKMRSQGVSEGMLFSFEEIIAHVTKDETLMPGEFIGSGTVGNGCGVELGWFLEHGDTIELDVEKIGVLKNKVERQDA
jgi:Fumarylacetoacetate (FAA) hydrolase family